MAARCALRRLFNRLSSNHARLPVVALVGAPNVGKSTLFNRLVDRPKRQRNGLAEWAGPEQRAIVSDEPGTTRDRLYGRVEWEGAALQLVDTAGLEEDDRPLGPSGGRADAAGRDRLAAAAEAAEVRHAAERQSELALREASAIVLVVDVSLGMTALDEALVARLRPLGKPLLLAVNKVDSLARAHLMAEFWELGAGEPRPVSALHGAGTGELLSALVDACARAHPNTNAPASASASAPDDEERNAQAARLLLRPLHIAIAGRPNAGKSSLLNHLLGWERAAVSAVAGTTRDALHAELAWEGRTLVLVDTAGLNRRVADRRGADAQGLAQLGASRGVRDATVVLVLFDAALGITQHDVSILARCADEGRSTVLCANKWDAARDAGVHWAAVERGLRESLPTFSHVPMLRLSAATGEGVREAMRVALAVAEGRKARIQTSDLNEAIAHAVALQAPPHGCAVRHAVQVDAEVPTFALFTRGRGLSSSYLRYLERCIREQVAFEGTPVRLVVKDDGSRLRGVATGRVPSMQRAAASPRARARRAMR
ncbi:hypothetical protein KFE25_002956 [Diacronema lutheri]|uniref:GTPase Der n=1 Tax=Diacronema lutheri TaxID=2081491 RepID=A0A8J5XSB8_DIALT|nr:hypothetical protein KFE25_002956 [Diacronema lutheri]